MPACLPACLPAYLQDYLLWLFVCDERRGEALKELDGVDTGHLKQKTWHARTHAQEEHVCMYARIHALMHTYTDVQVQTIQEGKILVSFHGLQAGALWSPQCGVCSLNASFHSFIHMGCGSEPLENTAPQPRCHCPPGSHRECLPVGLSAALVVVEGEADLSQQAVGLHVCRRELRGAGGRSKGERGDRE